MKLTAEQIEGYKNLHRQEFGEVLTDDLAAEYAQRWFSFFNSIFNINENVKNESLRKNS